MRRLGGKGRRVERNKARMVGRKEEGDMTWMRGVRR